MANVQITLLGQQLPTERVQEFLGIASSYGFTLQQFVDLSIVTPDIPDLGAYLQLELEGTRYRRSECVTRFEGKNLHALTGASTWDFFFSRAHKPYWGRTCACLKIDSIVIALMRERNLRFADGDPTAMFATKIREAGLPDPTTNVLTRVGIDWLEQCVYLTREDVLNVPGAGPKSLSNLETRLGMTLLKKW